MSTEDKTRYFPNFDLISLVAGSQTEACGEPMATP